MGIKFPEQAAKLDPPGEDKLDKLGNGRAINKKLRNSGAEGKEVWTAMDRGSSRLIWKLFKGRGKSRGVDRVCVSRVRIDGIIILISELSAKVKLTRIFWLKLICILERKFLRDGKRILELRVIIIRRENGILK